MKKLKNIKSILDMIERNLYTTNATLDYSRITDSIIKFADLVANYNGDSEDIWYLETNYSGASELIVGAYWHYTEWHGGQCSKEYLALSALGQIFDPGMSFPEDDNESYIALNENVQL